MRFLVLSILLALAGAVHAAPDAEQVEDIKLAPEQTINGPFDQVRQSMSERTSELVTRALGFIGVPYRFGGTSAETGFDCSGLVRAIYDQTVGHLLPRRAEDQAAATLKINQEDLRPGDLVFFNTMRRAFSHVGIYLGDGKFIHAPRTGARVRVESLSGSYWQHRFDGARRVLSLQDDIQRNNH